MTMTDRYLYSPWRMDYIMGDTPDDCVLCRFKDEGKDRENLIVHRGKQAYVVINLYPYNNGHLMVVPYAHESNLSDLGDATLLELMQLTQVCEQIFKQQYDVEGINIGINLGKAAGAGIASHLHLHAVPRWIGDDNFMCVIGGRRVIPEAFEDAWQRLHTAFANYFADKE